jgi:polyisoprenoid-binding protein YceI
MFVSASISTREDADMSDRFDIDPVHSRFGFAVRHMMVATVRGQFHDVSGWVAAPDGDLARGQIEVTIGSASVDTGVEARDNDLRSANFFDVANHPQITFRSTAIQGVGENEYAVEGELTMRGETRPVTLRGVVEGTVNDPFGNERKAASFSGRLNRRDWGLTWNMALEAGGVVVGDDVRVEIDVTVLRKVEAATSA